MSPRRWVVDAQVLQTGARHRGMGLYALELLSALDAIADVELEVLLSAAFADTEARDALGRRAPRARVETIDLRADTPGDSGVLDHNRAMLDGYLEGAAFGGCPADGFLLLSAMQGTTRPALPRSDGVARWALVYDLIPLLFHDTYLRVPELRQEYEARLAELLRADGFLTISRTVSNDLAAKLGIAPDRIVTIDGAPIPADGTTEPLPDDGVPFVLMPTGNDRRKNNRRAVAAFERFNAAHDHRYRLVVTSTFEPDEVQALRRACAHVTFTGTVSGAQLADLYARAEAVLFPPTYEGLGLPVLEALAHRTPVACSDIPVFREISDEAMQFFDPESVAAIATALDRAIAIGPSDRDVTVRILERYRWVEVARRLLIGTAQAPLARAVGRPQVTVVAPDLANDDQAAEVLAAAHDELTRAAEVRWVIETSGPAGGRYGYLTAALHAERLRPGVPIPDDRPLVYFLDGSAACAHTLVLALGLPGIVVLLSTDLSAAWAAAGSAGLIASSRLALEDELTHLHVPGTAHVAALLGVSRAVLVPTGQDRDRLREVARRVGRSVRIDTVSLPVPPLPFPELLPAKDRPYVELPETRPARYNPEFVSDLTLARSATAVLAAAEPVRTLRAMSRAAVPVVPVGADAGVPAHLLDYAPLGADQPAALRHTAGALAADPERRARLAAEGLAHLTAWHTPRQFAEVLLAAVRHEPAGDAA